MEKDVLVVLFVLNEAEAFLEGGNVAAVRVAEAVAAPGTTLARLALRRRIFLQPSSRKKVAVYPTRRGEFGGLCTEPKEGI